MVSLEKQKSLSFSMSASGINYEESDNLESTPDLDDQDNLNLISPLNSNQARNTEFRFKRLDTIPFGIFMILCAIALFTVSTITPIECDIKASCYLNSFSFLLYLHCLFWGISLIFDQFIQYQHIILRRRGYLEFYNEIRLLSQLQFWTVSTWSTFLVSVTSILHDYCESDTKCGISLPLSKSEYITICIGIELVILIPILLKYLYKVWQFNQAKSTPDVLRNDQMGSASEFDPNSVVGHIDEEVYQRQADLINYYKDQNAMLRRTVLELNCRLRNNIDSYS